MDLLIAVLAGGRSRRMGSDKAELLLAGATLLERVTGAAWDTGRPIVVVGRERPGAWRGAPIHFVEDELPGLGPLGGLATALRLCGTPVLAVGCDMPLITVRSFEWLAAEAQHGGMRNGLVSIDAGGRLQPLFAIYAGTLLPEIEERLARRDLAIGDLIAGADFRSVPIPDALEEEVRSVNTPDAFEALRAELEGG